MAQRAATDNQMKYINKLITDRELTAENVQKIIEHIGATSLDNLNIAQASDMICLIPQAIVLFTLNNLKSFTPTPSNP